MSQATPAPDAHDTPNRHRIAAYLSVKDEAGIIHDTISHLRSIGVDYIIACDISSTDGTAELLRAYESDNFHLVTISDDAMGSRVSAEESWSLKSFTQFNNAPADWVIFLDADEFWLPASGNLKGCRALLLADIVTVRRLNIVLGPDGPMTPFPMKPEQYDQVLLYADPIRDNRKHMRAGSNLSWIRGEVMPKIMAKSGKIQALTPGMHNAVVPQDVSVRRMTADDVVIAHLALSTRERFYRKVANVRDIYTKNGIDLSAAGETWQEYGIAWHWRRWASMRAPLDLANEFERNVLSADELSKFRHAGIIRPASDILSGATTSATDG